MIDINELIGDSEYIVTIHKDTAACPQTVVKFEVIGDWKCFTCMCCKKAVSIKRLGEGGVCRTGGRRGGTLSGDVRDGASHVLKPATLELNSQRKLRGAVEKLADVR